MVAASLGGAGATGSSLKDYARVRDRMVHRSVREEGVTWTHDRDATNVVWLLKDATMPDGTAGKVGQVFEIE